MKIRPVGAELFDADGRIDMTKLRVASRNFAMRLRTGTAVYTVGSLKWLSLNFVIISRDCNYPLVMYIIKIKIS